MPEHNIFALNLSKFLNGRSQGQKDFIAKHLVATIDDKDSKLANPSPLDGNKDVKFFDRKEHRYGYNPTTGEAEFGHDGGDEDSDEALKDVAAEVDEDVNNIISDLSVYDILDMISEDILNEILTPKSSAATWIHDFVHSKNPRFKGKTPRQRIKMALGAWYHARTTMKEEFNVEDVLNESIFTDALRLAAQDFIIRYGISKHEFLKKSGGITPKKVYQKVVKGKLQTHHRYDDKEE